MQKLEIDSENYLTFRPTPWDERLFGFGTNEIMEVKARDPELIDSLLRLFDRHNRDNGVKFSYTRVDAESLLLKKKLQEAGFYYAETSFYLARRNFQQAVSHVKRHNLLLLETPCDADFIQIREIAKNDFFHGRFHEDPNIEFPKAQQRYVNIIDDQKNLGRHFSVYRRNGEVLAFHLYMIAGNKCELILSGTKKERSMLSYYFWASLLEELKRDGIEEVTTMVSAANIPVLNLYSFFDFSFMKTLVGFHKMHSREANG